MNWGQQVELPKASEQYKNSYSETLENVLLIKNWYLFSIYVDMYHRIYFLKMTFTPNPRH